MMHDASLPPSPPHLAPVHVAFFPSPTGYCQSVPPLISTYQLQTLTWSQLTIFNSHLSPSIVPSVFFQLTFDFNISLEIFSSSLFTLCIPTIHFTQLFVICKGICHKLHVTQSALSLINVSSKPPHKHSCQPTA